MIYNQKGEAMAKNKHKIITYFREFRLRRQRKWFFEHYGHPDEAYFRAVLRWIKTGDQKCAD